MWPAVKKLYTLADFETYVRNLNYPSNPSAFGWRPSPEFIVVHNTSEPTLKQWPSCPGLQRMENLESYYRDDQGWSGGPHLFIAPEGIYAFNPLEYPGVHSPSWNRVSFGIEMVGEFDVEDFTAATQTMAAMRANATGAVAILSAKFDFDSSGLKFHKEDPKTTHKGCPGASVDKDDFIALVHEVKLAVLHRWGSN